MGRINSSAQEMTRTCRKQREQRGKGVKRVEKEAG
jgi:hypothetical protein